VAALIVPDRPTIKLTEPYCITGAAFGVTSADYIPAVSQACYLDMLRMQIKDSTIE